MSDPNPQPAAATRRFSKSQQASTAAGWLPSLQVTPTHPGSRQHTGPGGLQREPAARPPRRAGAQLPSPKRQRPSCHTRTHTRPEPALGFASQKRSHRKNRKSNYSTGKKRVRSAAAGSPPICFLERMIKLHTLKEVLVSNYTEYFILPVLQGTLGSNSEWRLTSHNTSAGRIDFLF